MIESIRDDLNKQSNNFLRRKFFDFLLFITVILSISSYLWYILFSGYDFDFQKNEFVRVIAVPYLVDIVCIVSSFIIKNHMHLNEHFKDSCMCIILWLISFNMIFSNYEFQLLVCVTPAIIFITGIFKDAKLIKLITYLSVISVSLTEIQSYIFLSKNLAIFFLDTFLLVTLNLFSGYILSAFIENEVAISDQFMDQYHKSEENISELNNEIIDIQETVILSVAEIIEAKSPQTGQHVKRVSEYVKLLCTELGYSSNEIEKIRIASMLHDIGKLSIPAEILEKKEKLTDSEYAVMKTHVTEGEKILSKTPGETMQLAKKIALEHHEKWDGNGYLHMKGESIDKISRIVAVADVFDALVSSRSYKASWKPEKAYEYMVSQSGKHFDPWVIEGFKKCYPDMVATLKKFPENINYSD